MGKRSIFVATLVATIAATAKADLPPDRLPIAAETLPPSIHQLELEHWKARAATGRVAWRDPHPASPGHGGPRAAPVREIHGYHPYWMGGAYADYDWSLLSTVAFFSIELDENGEVIDDHGWPWPTLISTSQANGVRVLVTATNFSAASLDVLLGSSSNRANAISNLIDAVLAGGADGINLDFENVPGTRKQDLVSFVGELGLALAAAIPTPYLSIATPAVDWSNAYDYDELASRCDHLMVMAYNYHWAGSSTTGPVAPLAGWGPYNVTWTIADYQAWGAPPGKIVLGVPYYGYRWTTTTGEPGGATIGAGVAVTYTGAIADAQVHGSLWDEESSTPWFRYQDGDWNQGWFEDSTSLGQKYDAVISEELAGVGIWALGYDGTRPELWTALNTAFGSGTTTIAAGPTAGDPPLRLAGPHPFQEGIAIEYTLDRHRPTRILVNDVHGRRIRELVRGVTGAGVIRWDGTDGHGRRVPAGVYFVRVELPRPVALKVVRVR